ncbi:hypothetical protein WL93_27925 [Burkholderia diffusa]|nr:hypothetical protein WL93_27925 [Burkholderia diffusa]
MPSGIAANGRRRRCACSAGSRAFASTSSAACVSRCRRIRRIGPTTDSPCQSPSSVSAIATAIADSAGARSPRFSAQPRYRNRAVCATSADRSVTVASVF